jgi:hypothetical protein
MWPRKSRRSSPIKRIAIRSGKDPLEPVSPEATLSSNLMGRNLGNFLFSAAAHKLMAAYETVPIGLSTLDLDPNEFNDNFDMLMLPLANDFRPSFEPSLNRYTELVENLRIPVVVLGVGAQSTIDCDLEQLQ